MSWFSVFFSWPGGGVWSNLIAAALWALPALEVNHARMKRHITRTLTQAPAETTKKPETAP
jgi:hypothetical protein